MKYFEETTQSQRIYEGKILNMRLDTVKLPNGNLSKREIVEHSGGVCVLPIDAEGNLYLVRQYRHPYGRELLELPAGKVNPGEDPFDCGRRELQEEVGCQAGRYAWLGALYPSPGYVTEVIHLYYAEELIFTRQQLDPDEFLDVVKLPFDQAVEMVLRNEIEDAKTQTAILKCRLLREQGALRAMPPQELE